MIYFSFLLAIYVISILFFNRVLGEDAWCTLVSLPCTLHEIRGTRLVIADVILKNGFKIEIAKGELSRSLSCTMYITIRFNPWIRI